ncbi:methyl-accepting chemotaxis protein [Sphingosinithalassobacter portus]|uniref:methyl-accepting chemotaxis protein n=1 Tax=Stakelama portus TaxID=2676234 RepID=UPI000D6E1649|nr:cache domain-containing protein [Sphingosinithalassobacter portus]
MLNWLNRLSLAAKTTLLTLLAIAVLAIASFLVTYNLAAANATRKAEAQQETNMRVAWEVIHQYGAEFRRDGDTLYVGDRALNNWYEPVDKVKQLVGGTATVFSGDTRVSTNVMKDDGSRAVGTKLAAGPTFDAVLRRGEPFRGQADILGKPYFTAYDPIKNAAGETIGVLYVGLAKADLIAELRALSFRMALVSIIVALVIGTAAFFACRSLFRPLSRMGTAMTAIADGDTATDIPGRDRSDEIGAMASALEHLRATAAQKHETDAIRSAEAERQRNVLTTVEAALARLQEGDLTATIDAEFPPAFHALRKNYNAAVESLAELVSEVKLRAEGIRGGSQEIAAASEDLARRTEGNAASIEQTAAATTQMDERLRTNAGAGEATRKRADLAIEVVSTGRTTADEAVQAMGRVSESAKGIDSVIEGLDKIAFQTRVLAMNAAVEAGRAGEAGRGFAVVADLVSALAMRAEEESKRARDQLTVTQTDIVAAVDMVQKVDGALADISTNVGEVHGQVATMAQDNRAQSTALSEVSTAIGAMDRATQQNAAMVEETSAAARNLLSEAEALARQAARFSVQGNKASAPRTARRGSPAETSAGHAYAA